MLASTVSLPAMRSDGVSDVVVRLVHVAIVFQVGLTTTSAMQQLQQRHAAVALK